MSQARYAIYYAPSAGSGLDRICSRLLGRCARTGQRLCPPGLPGIDPDRWTELTAAPRHYGLHATLKPPFFLAEGVTENELINGVAEFARQQRPFVLPPLGVETIGSFLALAPAEHCSRLYELASSCVMELDLFRRPPSSDELNKRRAKGLSPEQECLLQRWGYPYVLEEFRFHLTLTGSIADPDERNEIRKMLENQLAPVLETRVCVREIAVFKQEATSVPFTSLGDFVLAVQA